jgi:PAN domain
VNRSCLTAFAGMMLFAAFTLPTGATDYKHPGVYVDEGASRTRPSDGVNAAVPRYIVSDNRTAPLAPAGAAAMIGPGMQRDTNYYGSDYRHVDSLTAAQCQAACAKETQCKAWTWVKPGVQGPSAKCWLKNAVPAKSSNACCISGMKVNVPRVAIVRPPPAITPTQPKTALAPRGNQQALQNAPGAQPLAKDKAPVAYRARVSAPIHIENLQAKQLEQRLMDDKQKQSAVATSNYNEALLSERGAERLVQQGIIRPEVLSINHQRPAGFVFRPGVPVTISGRGFGSGGQIHLLASFRTTPKFTVNGWRPSAIYARLPDDIVGEDDLEDVRLEIQPTGKQPIVVLGVRFEAAREFTLLKEIPRPYVTLPGQKADYFTGGQRPQWPLLGTSAQSAYVERQSRGENADWFASGTDVYNLSLRPGFMIAKTDFWQGPTATDPNSCDNGIKQSGGQYFQGRYGVYVDGGNVVRVDWGVWRCHISPGIFDSSHNYNYSMYGLDVYVFGPRGVNPWK